MHITSTNSAKNLVSFFNFNKNSFLTKLVHTFTFSQKHDVKFGMLRSTIDIFSKDLIDFVFLMSNISRQSLHYIVNMSQKLDDFDFSYFKLVFTKFELIEEVKLDVLGFIEFFLKGN